MCSKNTRSRYLATLIIVTLKIAGFFLSFSSIFKIIFLNVVARIVILYLHFVSLKEDAM